MDGRGSRRTASYCSTLEDLHRIDLAYLRRQGCLQPNRVGSLRWSRGGSQVASIGYRVEPDVLVLDYRTCRPGEEAWQEVTQRVAFAHTAQHLGGSRLWLVCPSCRQRCGVLFGGQRFACRRCVKLPYPSQLEQPGDRKLRRAQAIRTRLGSSASTLDPFPAKPKGMRWTTYWRLKSKALDWTEASLLAVVKRFRLLGFGLS